MPLKLLDKRDIAQAKAADRALEVSEGMKLAKRVDALRETQAQEEASLNDFRTRTVESINAEITALNATKNALQLEVDDLENRKAQALKPLTAKENALTEREKKIDEASDAIERTEDSLYAAKLRVAEKEANLAILEASTVEMHKRATTILSGASDIHHDSEARLVALDARERDITTQEKALASKTEKVEKMLEEREANMTAAEENLRGQQRKLEDDFRRLESREGTLQRNITRLNK
jgi:predicted  nucleic acid-binding Zn-ribbon protein